MFTGIVTDIGTIESLERKDGAKLLLAVPFETSDINLGASLCCSGVCLSVTGKDQKLLQFDVSSETLNCTTVSDWDVGTPVNIERALKAGDELGGHLVMGHVDAVAKVLSADPIGGGDNFIFSLPEKIKSLVAVKGCIAINGVSLTVNNVTDDSFGLAIIPQTKRVTTFNSLKKGDKVNVEADIFARYSARQLEIENQT